MKKSHLTLLIFSFLMLSGCQLAKVEEVELVDADVKYSNAITALHDESEKVKQDVAKVTSGNASRTSSKSACYRIISDGEFSELQGILPIYNPEPLKALADEWTWGYLCRSADKGGYVVSVSKDANDDDRAAAALGKTNDIFRVTDHDTIEKYDTYYQFYFFPDHKMELTKEDTTKEFEAGDLSLITDLTWYGPLAGCNVEPGSFIADSGVVISCGHGDNGCAETKRVKWDLLTGESEYLGTCANNCDLETDEPFRLDCS